MAGPIGDARQAAVQRLADDPGFLLSRVGAAVRAGFQEVLARRGLRPLQYMILLILDAGSGVSQQQLCEATGIDSGNMVELLDGLEDLAYATRARDPRDRCRHLVTITGRGQSALARLRPAIEQYTNSFLSPLTEAERQQLTRSLGKLYVTTEGQPGAPRFSPHSALVPPAAGPVPPAGPAREVL